MTTSIPSFSLYDGLAKEKLAEMITVDQTKKIIGLERGMRPLLGQQLGV